MRRTLLFPLFLISLILPCGAQEPRAPINYIVVAGAIVEGCDSDNIQIPFDYGSDGFVQYGSLVRAGGDVYIDETDPFFPAGNDSTNWALYDLPAPGERGMQTASLPFPQDTPLTWEMTMFSEEYEPVWRATAKIDNCNGGALKKARAFKTKELLANNSFTEVIASRAPQPGDWKANTAALSANAGVLCGSAFAGTCYLHIDPVSGSTQTYKQTWRGSKGGPGQRLELALAQDTGGGYTGGGKVNAALTFANGTTASLTIDAPSTDLSMWTYKVDGMTMPAPLVKAVVTIRQTNGTGTDWNIDGISLTIFSRSNFTPPDIRGILPAPRPASP